jgi:hypothetical protein
MKHKKQNNINSRILRKDPLLLGKLDKESKLKEVTRVRIHSIIDIESKVKQDIPNMLPRVTVLCDIQSQLEINTLLSS